MCIYKYTCLEKKGSYVLASMLIKVHNSDPDVCLVISAMLSA